MKCATCRQKVPTTLREKLTTLYLQIRYFPLLNNKIAYCSTKCADEGRGERYGEWVEL